MSGLVFGCLDLYFGCLDLIFKCLDLCVWEGGVFGCLDVCSGCLDLYSGCLYTCRVSVYLQDVTMACAPPPNHPVVYVLAAGAFFFSLKNDAPGIFEHVYCQFS